MELYNVLMPKMNCCVIAIRQRNLHATVEVASRLTKCVMASDSVWMEVMKQIAFFAVRILLLVSQGSVFPSQRDVMSITTVLISPTNLIAFVTQPINFVVPMVNA